MKNRCVFLDRDGVINEEPPAGDYVRRWEDFQIIPAAIDWIRLFNVLGFLVIVVTNQRGVARGLMSADEVSRIHTNMRAELERTGAHVDDIFCCMHDDGQCDCRKPKPGLVQQAAQKWDIDLGQSLMIGDSEVDRQLAIACGMNFVEVKDGRVIGAAPSGVPASTK